MIQKFQLQLHTYFLYLFNNFWVAKVLKFQLQHHSLQRNPRTDLLQNDLVGSPCSPRDSQESSPTPQFKSIHSLVLSLEPSTRDCKLVVFEIQLSDMYCLTHRLLGHQAFLNFIFLNSSLMEYSCFTCCVSFYCTNTMNEWMNEWMNQPCCCC